MPLEILAPLVAAGLMLVIGTVWFLSTGGAKTKTDDRMIAARFEIDYPGERVVATAISEDRALFFVKTARGQLGLVKPIGQNYLTRLLDKRDIVDVRVTKQSAFIELHDFTLPHASFQGELPPDMAELLKSLTK